MLKKINVQPSETEKEESVPASPKADAPKKSQRLKWIVRGLGLLVSAIIVLILVVYFVLRSGSLTQSVVPELKPYLEPLGIQLHKMGLLRIDLLKSIELNDFQLEWQDASIGHIALNIGKFNVEYSLLSLLDKRLDITRVLLQDVTISANLKPSEESEPLSLSEIEDLLSNPPFLLSANDIQFNNIRWDIQQAMPDGSIQYRGELTNTQLALDWTPSTLKGFFNLTLGQRAEKNRMIFQSTLDEKPIEISATPSVSINAQWHLENHQKQWKLNDTSLNVDTKLTQVKLIQDDKKTLLDLPLFDFKLYNKLSSVNLTTRKTGLIHLFPIQLNSQISSKLLDANINNIDQENLSLSGQASHHFKLDLNGDIDPFNSHLPSLQFELTESLNLENLDLQLDLQKTKATSLAWALNAKGETKQNAALNITLDANAAISNFALDQQGKTPQDIHINVTANPEFHLMANATLNSFDQPLAHLIAQFSPNITLKNLVASITENKQTKSYTLPHSRIRITANYDKKDILLDTELQLNNAKIPEVKKTFSLKNQTTVKTDLDLQKINLNTALQLDHYSLMDLSLNIENQKNFLTLQHALKMELSPALVEYHDAASALDSLGEPHIQLTGKTRLKHNTQDIQQANFELFETWKIDTTGQLTLTQYKPPPLKAGVFFSKPLEFNYTVNKLKNYQIDIDLRIPDIQTPPLEKPLSIRLTSKNNLTWPLTKTTSNNRLDIAGKRALDIRLSVNDKKHFLAYDSTLSLYVDPAWQVYLKELDLLEDFGALSVKSHIEAKIKHPYSSILDFTPETLDQLIANVSLNTTLSQDTAQPGSLMQLTKPLTLNQTLNWSADQLQWQANATVADLTLPDIARLSDIQTKLSLDAASGLKPQSAKLAVQVDQGNILLLSADPDVKAMQVGHVATPLSLNTSASWTEEQVDLKEFILNVGENLFAMNITGTASLDGKNAQLTSEISSQLRENLLNEPKISGSGNIQVPLRLTLLDGKQIALEGEVLFDAVNLMVDELEVQNLNGSLTLEEELIVNNGNAKFRYLLTPNPFQRVDFTRVQPYLSTQSLSIDKLSTAEQSIGPILASVMLKQNIFSLQQFDIDLFDGHAAGKFYLDVSPGAWKLGLLSRMTHIDPRQLLDKDSKLRNSQLSPINSRVAIEFDLPKRLMEGEITISQMSRDQLLQLLDVIDPAHKDEQMAQLRTGLRFSHPTLIDINMQRGLMNLKVKISGLAKAIRVTGLPLTPIIQQNASDLLLAIDQIPME